MLLHVAEVEWDLVIAALVGWSMDWVVEVDEAAEVMPVERQMCLFS